MVQRREGMKFIEALETDEFCVSMTEFQGRVLILTNYRLFELIGETLKEVEVTSEPIEPGKG